MPLLYPSGHPTNLLLFPLRSAIAVAFALTRRTLLWFGFVSVGRCCVCESISQRDTREIRLLASFVVRTKPCGIYVRTTALYEWLVQQYNKQCGVCQQTIKALDDEGQKRK